MVRPRYSDPGRERRGWSLFACLRSRARGVRDAAAPVDEFAKVVAAAAHGLRQPLQALTLDLATLDLQVERRTRPVIGNLQRSAAAIEAHLDALMTLAALADGRLSLAPHELELPPLLDGLIDRLRAERPTVPVACRVRGADGLRVRGDAAGLASLLRHAAWRLLPDDDDCRLSIDARAVGDRVAVTLCIEAVQADAPRQPELFERPRGVVPVFQVGHAPADPLRDALIAALAHHLRVSWGLDATGRRAVLGLPRLPQAD